MSNEYSFECYVQVCIQIPPEQHIYYNMWSPGRIAYLVISPVCKQEASAIIKAALNEIISWRG